MFDRYVNIVSLVADHATLLTVAITAIVFVRAASGVFPVGLRKVFGPLGISSASILRAFFLCWRSRADQRLFFEFALVRSHGEKLDANSWKSICSDFSVLKSLPESSKSRTIEVKNCTNLTNRDFAQSVSRYFSFLSEQKASAAYSVGRYSDYWCFAIRISEVYVTPSVLLSGLMSRFDSDWEIFIDRYRSSIVSSRERGILSSELYGLFSWLLWGPSKEINWHDGWDGLCQLSYGDENNSLQAYADRESGMLDSFRTGFSESLKKGGFGFLSSLDIRLVPKRSFFADKRFSIDIRNAYFVDRTITDNDQSFVPVVVSATPAESRNADSWYSTAYLWLLFERDGDSGFFDPERSVAFFEHANIADSNVTTFLMDRLADKAISHFRRVYESPESDAVSYSLVCGMNEAVERYFRHRFEALLHTKESFSRWLRKHVSLSPKREPAAVFCTLDEFFSNPDRSISFLDIDASDGRAHADLALFYSDIYTPSFPNDDERESLTNILLYLRQSTVSSSWKFKVLVAKDGSGRIVGGVIFDYFCDVNSVVVEFICVDKSVRARHIGKKIWIEVLRTADSIAQKHGHKCATHVFCEVESPAIKPDGDLRHLDFWRSNWFRRLEFEYVQPALGEDLKPVEGLWLLCVTRTPDRLSAVPSRLVTRVLWNYIHYSMGVAEPEKDECYVMMKNKLDEGNGEVLLSEF